MIRIYKKYFGLEDEQIEKVIIKHEGNEDKISDELGILMINN